MNDKLILRSTNSPYGDINKGSVLSQSELDGDFILLKGLTIYTAETSSNTLTLKKLNGDEIEINISASTSDIYTTGATLVNDTVYFDRNDTLSAYTVNLSSITSNLSYKETISLTGNTTYTVTHNLNNLDIIVQVKNLNTNEMVGVTVDNYQLNSVDLTSTSHITSARIMIVGI